jgi:hypothetical protein
MQVVLRMNGTPYTYADVESVTIDGCPITQPPPAPEFPRKLTPESVEIGAWVENSDGRRGFITDALMALPMRCAFVYHPENEDGRDSGPVYVAYADIRSFKLLRPPRPLFELLRLGDCVELKDGSKRWICCINSQTRCGAWCDSRASALDPHGAWWPMCEADLDGARIVREWEVAG